MMHPEEKLALLLADHDKARQDTEQLRVLARDLLAYLKDKAPYTYASAPQAYKLQERAKELGVEVP